MKRVTTKVLWINPWDRSSVSWNWIEIESVGQLSDSIELSCKFGVIKCHGFIFFPVGNIPYEATEEKLKEIFSEVGPVLSLKWVVKQQINKILWNLTLHPAICRLVFDRESGKPKGYGFCEYKDQETALSAMRNLNGYEIGGRTLRVDNACTEKSRMEMQQLLQGPQVENPYGEHCDAEQAPEIITKTVTSLPPEQMYELMKQMKLCIQNNPSEARQMLLLNPQLAYALLQSMVVMRIVDPQTAVVSRKNTCYICS